MTKRFFLGGGGGGPCWKNAHNLLQGDTIIRTPYHFFDSWAGAGLQTTVNQHDKGKTTKKVNNASMLIRWTKNTTTCLVYTDLMHARKPYLMSLMLLLFRRPFLSSDDRDCCESRLSCRSVIGRSSATASSLIGPPPPLSLEDFLSRSWFSFSVSREEIFTLASSFARLAAHLRIFAYSTP